MSVITALEQEHGTELDLVPTLHLPVMEGRCIYSFICMFSFRHPYSGKNPLTITFWHSTFKERERIVKMVSTFFTHLIKY